MSAPRVRCLIVFEPPDAKARRMTLSETAEYYRDHFIELAEERAALLSERETARQALFECFVHAGADTDGATTLEQMGNVDIGARAVRAVKELRADYDADPDPADLSASGGQG